MSSYAEPHASIASQPCRRRVIVSSDVTLDGRTILDRTCPRCQSERLWAGEDSPVSPTVWVQRRISQLAMDGAIATLAELARTLVAGLTPEQIVDLCLPREVFPGG